MVNPLSGTGKNPDFSAENRTGVGHVLEVASNNQQTLYFVEILAHTKNLADLADLAAELARRIGNIETLADILAIYQLARALTVCVDRLHLDRFIANHKMDDLAANVKTFADLAELLALLTDAERLTIDADRANII